MAYPIRTIEPSPPIGDVHCVKALLDSIRVKIRLLGTLRLRGASPARKALPGPTRELKRWGKLPPVRVANRGGMCEPFRSRRGVLIAPSKTVNYSLTNIARRSAPEFLWRRARGRIRSSM